MEPLSILADDGFPLGAHLFQPTTRRPRGAVVIAGGTAIPQRFYAPYAAHLAQAGFAVTTYDYRGIGASRPKGIAARGGMTAWAKDADRVLRVTRERFAELPLIHVGHSFGGQVLGLMPNAPEMLDGVVLISAQSGFYGHWPMPARLRMAATWYGLFPAFASVLGHVPKWAMGEELPGDVAREWAEWCRTPGYLSRVVPREKQYFRAFRQPMLAYSFTDDDYAPGRSTEELLSWFRNASIEHRVRDPERVGARVLGHFGFFRKPQMEMWNETIDWIETLSNQTSRGHAA
ncbi:MAG: alpha/beta hydrolase family protein [Polyangiales bacterium]